MCSSSTADQIEIEVPIVSAGRAPAEPLQQALLTSARTPTTHDRRTEYIALRSRGNMFRAFLPNAAKRVMVYLEPVNTRWGPDRLRTLCCESLGKDPDVATAFLFINKNRDTLIFYFVDETGDQTLMKKIEKGAFLLPAPDPEGSKWASVRPSMLPRLFRA